MLNISENVRSAIRLLLALDKAEGPLSIVRLVETTGVAYHMVESTHAALKKRDVTGTVAGRKGGIVLKAPLGSLSLGLLLDWFEPQDGPEAAQAGEARFTSEIKAMLEGLSSSVEHRIKSAFLSAVRREFASTTLDALAAADWPGSEDIFSCPPQLGLPLGERYELHRNSIDRARQPSASME